MAAAANIQWGRYTPRSPGKVPSDLYPTMNVGSPLVIFANIDRLARIVDGVSWCAASGLLDVLARQRVPVVSCSGRTRAEVELIGQELALEEPFVTEHGSGVFIPRGYFGDRPPGAHHVVGYEVVEFGRPYAEVVGLLGRTADRLRIATIGFADMSVEEVALDCGISLMQARLAKLREYAEPFRLVNEDTAARRRLLSALSAVGLECTSSGRYDHASGTADRSASIRLLISLYHQVGGPVLTVGIGKGLNDLPMLRYVDVQLITTDDEEGKACLASAVDFSQLSLAAGTHLSDAVIALLEVAQSQRNGSTVWREVRP